MTSKMPGRVKGALLPDTAVTWREDGTNLDPTGYAWKIEARTVTTATVLFTKTTGFTNGTIAGPTVTVAWAIDDLGTLTAGTYLLELTGTIGTKSRKEQLILAVATEV